jgi:hypothetical protein
MGNYVAESGAQKASPPGVETRVTPDRPDVLDGGHVVDGVGVDDLAAGCRVRRVGWWFLVGMAQ